MRRLHLSIMRVAQHGQALQTLPGPVAGPEAVASVARRMSRSRLQRDAIDGAGRKAQAAFRAQVREYAMGLLREAGDGIERAGFDAQGTAHALRLGDAGDSAGAHRIFMPGCAPSSSVSNHVPSSSPAARIMPSDVPKRIWRGSRLATITISRPFNCSGV